MWYCTYIYYEPTRCIQIAKQFLISTVATSGEEDKENVLGGLDRETQKEEEEGRETKRKKRNSNYIQ